jgi:hypothetical protein
VPKALPPVAPKPVVPVPPKVLLPKAEGCGVVAPKEGAGEPNENGVVKLISIAHKIRKIQKLTSAQK